MPIPAKPKIYHIVHVDRLSSIAAGGFLWCDAEIGRRNPPGTGIGMDHIKKRRLSLSLSSHPNLHVGDCVPFNFCPRSVMLYVIHMANYSDLSYRGGQGLIIHLAADLRQTIAWAEANNLRWAFTTSNAGASYCEYYCAWDDLSKINWDVMGDDQWAKNKENKQAEFLLENCFPWHLIERIGVYCESTHQQAANAMPTNGHRPPVEIIRSWYY